MEKIASFTVDHLRLMPGIYVSRVDMVGDMPVTTLDIRMTRPNFEPVMGTAPVHAIEHLGATWLRNERSIAENIIYFGPMGCRTGFYLVMAGKILPADAQAFIRRMFEFIVDFEGDIPGASPKDCGNCLDMNLPMAKYAAKKFLSEVFDEEGRIYDERTVYPQ